MYFVIVWVASGQHICVSVENVVGCYSSHVNVRSHGVLWFDEVAAKDITDFRKKKARDGS